VLPKREAGSRESWLAFLASSGTKDERLKFGERAVYRSDLICSAHTADSSSPEPIFVSSPHARSVPETLGGSPTFPLFIPTIRARIARALSLPDPKPMRGRRRGKSTSSKSAFSTHVPRGYETGYWEEAKARLLVSSRHSIAVPVRVSTWRIFCRRPRTGACRRATW
jgi:hypothetical protein